jgi:ABC-type multidrug transport system fused ATPase/permease subunit
MLASVDQIAADNQNSSHTTVAAAQPASVYQQRCAQFGARRDEFDRRSHRNANVNLTLFVAVIVFIGVGFWREQLWPFGAAALCALGFVGAIARHTWIDRMQRRYDELWTINDEGLRRLRRDWATLPLRQPPAASQSSADSSSLAADLDLVGHASLQHLLGTPGTPIGLTTVLHWLLEPAPPATVPLRQAAVAELAPLIDFRDQLALRGRLMERGQNNYELFLRWAESERWLHQRPWLIWLTRLVPLVTVALILAQLGGLLDAPLWIAGLAINLGLILTIGNRIDEYIEQVSTRQSIFRAYADIFGLIGTQPFAAGELRRLQAELSAGNLRADQQMQRLGTIMAFADFRFFMFFFPIKLLTLWNFHVAWALERWQQIVGGRARAWLTALGELEALAALATLAFDNQDWTFPEMAAAAEPMLAARRLSHPLLLPAVRVGNDVTIGPPGTFLLVTGSNMSGKSTLLRSIGLNVTLAQAGGPVSADWLRLPPLRLATSMRVQDSLEQGVSYFMAELRRLKEVVDAAQRVRASDERALLYLLDEILHGTNSTERQIAARQIIRHLLAQPAIGAVSTHDLTLAADESLAGAAQTVHFTETFSRDVQGLHMQFDYTLRPGLATSTNALKLMELVGLPLDEALREQAESGPVDRA